MFKNKQKAAQSEEVQDGTEAANIDVSEIQEDADETLAEIDACINCLEADEEEIEENLDPEPQPENYYNTQIDWANATAEEEAAWDEGAEDYKAARIAWAERNDVYDGCTC